MADRFRTVYNTGDSPVIVDQEGHVIGGGEWGTIDFRDKVAKEHLHSGLLVEVKAPEEGTFNPDAKTAIDATEEANANAEAEKDDDSEDPKGTEPDTKTSDTKSKDDNKAATAAKKGKE
jgi:hypothetical protein